MAGITYQALSRALPNGTAVYVALFTTLPTSPAAAGTGAVEVSGSAYARVACSSWTQHATNTLRRQNNAAVTFAALTGAVSGVVGWGLYDALTGGNLIAYGPMRSASGGAATSRSFIATDQPQFAVGELWVEIQVV